MGWLACDAWSSPKDIQNELLRGFATCGRLEVVAQKTTNYGRNWWLAIKNLKTGSVGILLVLMRRGFREGWGYKDLDEAMGPVEDDCPVSLLDLCTEPENEWAKQWRQRVRDLAARRSQTFEPGVRVKVWGKEYTVERKVRKSYIIRRDDGRVFRTTPAKMYLVA